MGNVRTDQIKRLAKELIRRFPDKFSHDFEGNKQLVSALVKGATPKVRNQVAGYITRRLAGVELETEGEEVETELPQEGEEPQESS